MMDMSRHQTAAREAHEVNRFQFIVTELDLAITFCEIAITAADDEKAVRNAQNAKRAYNSATHFLWDASLTVDMGREIEQRMTLLAPMLHELDLRQGWDGAGR